MENKKVTLIYIIILLCIFIPLTSVGIYYRFYGEVPETPSIPKEEKGYIYFYENNEIKSRYKCDNLDCSYALYTIDDKNYKLEYHSSTDVKSSIINDKYVFIKDEKIVLYDIDSKETIDSFDSIKNYGIGFDKDYVLASKDNKWGIISFENDYEVLVDFTYDFIGSYNNIINNKLDSSLFAVLKDNTWSVISTTEILYETSDRITSYTDSYVTTINSENEYFQYNYAKRNLNTNPLSYAGFINEFTIVVNKDNIIYIKDVKNNKVLTEYIKLELTNYIDDSSLKAFEVSFENNILKLIVNSLENDPKTYTYNLEG